MPAAEPPATLDLRRHRDLESRGWHPWASRVLLLGVLALLVLALVGVFGQRPATSRAESAAAALSVSAPTRLRGGLLFQARFRLTARRDLRHAALVLDPGWFDGIQVNSFNPPPAAEGGRDGRVVLELGRVAAGRTITTYAEFQVNPTNVGRRSQGVELTDGSRTLLTIHRTLTIFP